MNKSLPYRNEIDGLRAIAVICVILYHAGLHALQGGFLGVDIFFVISGYLIAKIINLDLIKNDFSFLQFYKRRIGRIVPALLFMVAITYIASWFLFLPGPHKVVGHYATTGLLASSNILLHIKSQDYFGLENSGNPFFHTWSLGVEEQFYMIYPILAVSAVQLKIKPKKIAVFIFISSIIIYLTTAKSHTFSFYMMPARAWELSIGIFAATINNPFKNKNLSIAIGVILIFTSLAYADKASDSILVFMLAITTGTALLLINCEHQSGIGKILSTRLLKVIGKGSYSLYLWHVPIYVFIFYLVEKSIASYVFYAALLIFTSFISYKFIELPFRNGKNFKTLLAIGTPAFVLLIAMGIVGHLNGGFPNRSDILSNLQINNGFGLQCNGNSKITADCSTSNKPEIAILGNSYAMVYARAIDEQSGQNTVQLTKDSCAIGYIDFIKEDPNGNCMDFFNDSIKTILENPSIKTVVISSPFSKETSSKEFEISFNKLLKDLSNKKIVVIGPTPTAPFQVGECVYTSSLIKTDSDCSFALNNEHKEKLTKLKMSIKDHPNIIFLDITKIICPDGVCIMRSMQNDALYLDHGHLTHTGASLVIQQLELFEQ